MATEGGVAAEGGSECGDDQALEFEGEPEAEAGRRNPLKVQDPQLPSEEEVKCHELTHLPYRSWCSHCVRGKGKAIDHRKQNTDPKIPEVHVDYCFFGSAADTRPRCILVAKQFGTKYLLASVVPLKGASHEIPAKRMCAFLKELGLEHGDVVFMSDQEAALGDLLQEVVKRRGDAKTFVEQSPVASSASNGVIERRNLSVEGQVSVLKDAFEARLGKKVPSDHAALAWLVEFGADQPATTAGPRTGGSGGSRRSC